jgi:hypothetical protein
MHGQRLIERQRSLLDYLTSDRAIFEGAPPRDPALAGFDAGRLRLEALFSFQKRIDKVRGVLPRTFALLGDAHDGVVRDFVAARPPVSISRMDNARAFHEFLAERADRASLIPPWLPDVAACELAFAAVRMGSARPEPAGGRRRPIRLAPDVALLHCHHDVRSCFEADGGGAPVRRDTQLAVALPAGSRQPRVFQLPAPIYALLCALAAGDPAPALAIAGDAALRDELGAYGLIEVAG